MFTSILMCLQNSVSNWKYKMNVSSRGQEFQELAPEEQKETREWQEEAAHQRHQELREALKKLGFYMKVRRRGSVKHSAGRRKRSVGLCPATVSAGNADGCSCAPGISAASTGVPSAAPSMGVASTQGMACPAMAPLTPLGTFQPMQPLD